MNSPKILSNSQTNPDKPRQAQARPDNPRRTQTSPDTPRQAQTSPDKPRQSQTSQDMPRHASTRPNKPQKPLRSLVTFVYKRVYKRVYKLVYKCLCSCLRQCLHLCLHLCIYMFTHTSQNMLDRWRWHKHRLFPNARLNLSLTYIDLAWVAILHFQSGRVVRALVEPSNITLGQCSNPHVVPPGLA
jgi:hypothetical protein